jgi:hypothetical protein
MSDLVLTPLPNGQAVVYCPKQGLNSLVLERAPLYSRSH